MFESLVVDLLNKHLGDFVFGLNKEQLKLGVFRWVLRTDAMWNAVDRISLAGGEGFDYHVHATVCPAVVDC